MTDLRLENLKASLGGRQFFYEAFLSGPAIVAITGASGAGKSTLFHLIAGFQTPESGRVLVDGTDISRSPPGLRPLTYIFQEHNLFGHLDVFANVALGVSPSLRLDAVQREQVETALADVGLGGFSKRGVRDLSGGERQRVAFARALVRRRPLLLLDEAFGSLDQDLRYSMGNLLLAMQQKHSMLVLMITHDPGEAERLSSRQLTIDNGRIVYDSGGDDNASFVQMAGARSQGLKFD